MDLDRHTIGPHDAIYRRTPILGPKAADAKSGLTLSERCAAAAHEAKTCRYNA